MAFVPQMLQDSHIPAFVVRAGYNDGYFSSISLKNYWLNGHLSVPQLDQIFVAAVQIRTMDVDIGNGPARPLERYVVFAEYDDKYQLSKANGVFAVFRKNLEDNSFLEFRAKDVADAHVAIAR